MPDRTAMLQALAASPVLALEPRYLGHMLAVIEGRQAAKPVRSPLVMGRPVQGTTIIEGVGIVPVMGPLMPHPDEFAEFFGAVSIDSLRASVRALVDHPDVYGMLFLVDSPGGPVEGCTDFAAELFATRGTLEADGKTRTYGPGQKPSITVACSGIYSAAYWTFSAAEQVLLPVDGGAGSIGVLGLHVDQSEMLEKIGLKVRIFKSGAKKDALSPFGPLSEDAAREIQADVDAHAARFHKDVARHRGLSVATVKGFEAGVFSAADAVTAKLADSSTTTLDAAFLALRKSASTPGRGRTAAQKEPTMPDPEKPQGSNVLDFEAERARIRDEERAAARREEKQRSAAINSLCAEAGFTPLAAGMLERELTVEQAKAELATCGGIRDAAFAGKLTDEQTNHLLAQVATGLTLAEANAKVVAIMKQASGPEINGRHAPAASADAPTPLTPIAAVYARLREQAAAAHASRYGALRR